MRNYIIIFLLLFIGSQGISQDTTGTVVILSDKIGPTIDLEERNFYRLFIGIQKFESAVLLYKSDSSYTFKLIIRNNDEPSFKTHWISCNKEEIVKIRNNIETCSGIQNKISNITDSIGIEIKHQDKFIELSACASIYEEPYMIFRILIAYNIIGFEPSFIIDSYGNYVVSGSFVLSPAVRFRSIQIRPFGTIGYGLWFPYKEEMVNFGFGLKCQFSKSLGIRFQYIGFTTFQATYNGPTVGLSYFINL